MSRPSSPANRISPASSAPTPSPARVPRKASRRPARRGVVKIVVFDAVPGIDASLKSGLVDVAIAQKPSEMGYVGVKFASDLIKGKTIPAWQGTGFVVMDKSNIDQEDVRTSTSIRTDVIGQGDRRVSVVIPRPAWPGDGWRVTGITLGPADESPPHRSRRSPPIPQAGRGARISCIKDL